MCRRRNFDARPLIFFGGYGGNLCSGIEIGKATELKGFAALVRDSARYDSEFALAKSPKRKKKASAS
jgi:hypothetical protein